MQKQAVRKSSMIDRLREADPFHGLHIHLIYHFRTIFLWECIKTNINKTRIKDLNDLKTPIIQEIQLIEKKKEFYMLFFLI